MHFRVVQRTSEHTALKRNVGCDQPEDTVTMFKKRNYDNSWILDRH